MTQPVPSRDSETPRLSKTTLQDVARDAGVSAMTVSRVVNEQPGVKPSTRRHVEGVIKRLGYRPNIVARGLKASHSNTLGLLVPDVTNPYFPSLVRGAEDVAFEAGYTLLLHNVIEDREREAAALTMFEERRVDGVIVCSPRLPEDRLYDHLARHASAVVVNRRAPADLAGSVRVDHEVGARLAARHLLDHGHQTIAVLAGPKESSAGVERLEGIRAELGLDGLEIPGERIVSCPPTMEGGAAAARDLLERVPNVDAVLCFNDLVATGTLLTARQKGLSVPYDLSVVGYDDIAYARMFSPALTTLRVPTYDIGAHAMRMLLSRMNGEQRTISIVVQPELIIRESTRMRPSSTLLPTS